MLDVSQHQFARRPVGDDLGQLTDNAFRCKSALDQLWHDLSACNQVGHGKGVQAYQAAAQQPRELSQPVDDDEWRSRQSRFHRGRATGDHASARMHERSAGIVGQLDWQRRRGKLTPQPALLQRGRHRQNILKIIALSLQQCSRLQHGRQVEPDFFFPAAGQQRDPLLSGVKAVVRGKFFPRDLRRGRVGQRVPDIADIDSVLLIEILLERKDHNHLADVLPDLLDPSGTPGPHLRADKIKNGNAKAVQLARQPQVEVRKINEDGRVRLALSGFYHQMVETAADARQMRQDLYQSHHGDFIGVDQQIAACGAHLLSAHAEEA